MAGFCYFIGVFKQKKEGKMSIQVLNEKKKREEALDQYLVDVLGYEKSRKVREISDFARKMEDSWKYRVSDDSKVIDFKMYFEDLKHYLKEGLTHLEKMNKQIDSYIKRETKEKK